MNVYPPRQRLILSAVTVAAIATVGVVGVLGVRTFAADAPVPQDSIVVSPANQNLTLKAGAVATGKLTVVNDGASDEKFIVYGRPYSVKNEQYDPDFERTGTNTDIYQWVQFTTTSYDLPAGKTLEVPYRIQVPATAAPGGHYGVIFVETQPKSGSADSVMRKKRVGSLLQATIEGTGTQRGQLLSSATSFWQTTPPLTATSRVESTGNTDFQATTNFTVKDMFGRTKYHLEKSLTVYPGTTRKITHSWEGAPWFGLFRVEQSTTVLGQTAQSSQYVLMTPRWLPVVFFLIIVAWIIYGRLHRQHR